MSHGHYDWEAYSILVRDTVFGKPLVSFRRWSLSVGKRNAPRQEIWPVRYDFGN